MTEARELQEVWRRAGGVVLVSQRAGFMSNFCGVLGLLDRCERTGEVPSVWFTTGIYRDPDREPNWWRNYFLPVSPLESPDVKRTRSVVQFATQMAKDGFRLSPDRGHELIRGWIHPLPHVLRAVDIFCGTKMVGHVIGVQYRGTDFVRHGGVPIPVDYVAGLVHEHLKALPSDQSWLIFVSSDEQRFVDQMRDKYGHKVVACNCLRADGEVNIVHDPRYATLGYRKGLEVLVNSLLLSRCNWLFRTRSGVSNIALKWNPSLVMDGLDMTAARKRTHDDKALIKVLRRRDEQYRANHPNHEVYDE